MSVNGVGMPPELPHLDTADTGVHAAAAAQAYATGLGTQLIIGEVDRLRRVERDLRAELAGTLSRAQRAESSLDLVRSDLQDAQVRSAAKHRALTRGRSELLGAYRQAENATDHATVGASVTAGVLDVMALLDDDTNLRPQSAAARRNRVVRDALEGVLLSATDGVLPVPEGHGPFPAAASSAVVLCPVVQGVAYAEPSLATTDVDSIVK